MFLSLGFLPYLILGVVLITIIVIVIALLVVRINKTMFKKITDVLEKNYSSFENYSLTLHTKMPYDIVLKFRNLVFYIKVVKNFNNSEICVNNKTKWQLRQSAFDNQLRMVENIEGLIMMQFDENQKRNSRKLFIVYPNAKNLLKYINECEMIFIYPNTDVYGANIITYKSLEEDGTLLNAK